MLPKLQLEWSITWEVELIGIGNKSKENKAWARLK